MDDPHSLPFVLMAESLRQSSPSPIWPKTTRVSHPRQALQASVTHPDEAALPTVDPRTPPDDHRRVFPLSWAPHAQPAWRLLWWAFPLTRAGGGSRTVCTDRGTSLGAPAAGGHPRLDRESALRRACADTRTGAGRIGTVVDDGLDQICSESANWLYAGLMGLGILGYARTPKRRLLVVAIIALAGLDQFGQGWVSWWGGGTATDLMTGSFGWHNPFAAFMAAPFVIGCVLAAKGRATVRLASLLAVPWLGAGLLLSGSRATTGLVILAVVAVAGVHPSPAC